MTFARSISTVRNPYHTNHLLPSFLPCRTFFPTPKAGVMPNEDGEAMKKTLENRLSMIYAVRDVCDAHTATWTPLVPYTAAYTELRTILDTIEGHIETQERQLEGIAEDKRKKKEVMVDKALEIAKAGFALALSLIHISSPRD